MIRNLYIFNPDSDICLAAGSRIITPSAAVKAFIKRNELLPAVYAEDGSAILCSDKFLTKAFIDIAERRGLEIVTDDDIKGEDYRPMVWGWCRQIRDRLISLGIKDKYLPSDDVLDMYRKLSHRAISIEFYKEAHASQYFNDISIPLEITNEKEAMETISSSSGCYLKAPWSSSGRGVFDTQSMNAVTIGNAVRGVISRQGSVMIEPRYNSKADFATEWTMKNGIAHYEGLSLFETIRGGKYTGNIVAPEAELMKRISLLTDVDLPETIELQKSILQRIIGSGYEGPLGIDMMVLEDRSIVPCVEINLRMTMGRVAISALHNTDISLLRIF